MRVSTLDNLKNDVVYWENELAEAKKACKCSAQRKLNAMRKLNFARLAIMDRDIEQIGFTDCPLFDDIACAKNGEVMSKANELVYESDSIKRNGKTYQAHRLIAFTFCNEENYPTEFLNLFCDVHHKDGNHKNNVADNLCFVTKDYHMMLHHHKVEFNDEIRKTLIAQAFEMYSKCYE